MENKSIIISKLTEMFEKFGFKKSGQYWYIYKDGVFIVFAYQGSIGDGFYLNIGLSYSVMFTNEKKPIKQNQWQYWSRFEHIAKLTNTEQNKLFSFESFSISELEICFVTKVLPTLLEVSSIKYLLSFEEPTFELKGGLRNGGLSSYNFNPKFLYEKITQDL